MKKALFLGAFIFAITAGYAQTDTKAPTTGMKSLCPGGEQAKCCAHSAGKPSCCAHAQAAPASSDASKSESAPVSNATVDRKAGSRNTEAKRED